MSAEGQKFYPGEEATPKQLLRLAAEYRQAAEALLPVGRRKAPLSRWPYRLVAIHSVELFLNAYLLANGISPETVRGLQHNLAERTKLAVKAGLKLKRRTAEHLQALTTTREYLVARYVPVKQRTVSQVNRLQATLKEIAEKVEAVVDRK
jgi:hypothetical protein